MESFYSVASTVATRADVSVSSLCRPFLVLSCVARRICRDSGPAAIWWWSHLSGKRLATAGSADSHACRSRRQRSQSQHRYIRRRASRRAHLQGALPAVPCPAPFPIDKRPSAGDGPLCGPWWRLGAAAITPDQSAQRPSDSRRECSGRSSARLGRQSLSAPAPRSGRRVPASRSVRLTPAHARVVEATAREIETSDALRAQSSPRWELPWRQRIGFVRFAAW